MKNNKLLTFIIISLLSVGSVSAEYSYVDSSDFTGDAFFTSPISNTQEGESEEQFSTSGNSSTMPPLKRLRIKMKNYFYHKQQEKNELAPVLPKDDIYSVSTETSKYISKDEVENFEEKAPEIVENDEITDSDTSKRKFFNRKNKKNVDVQDNNEESIILDCDNIDYDTDKYCIYATGNVNVHFVKQNTDLKANTITYDRANNTIKAEGDVKILREGQTITGDYIFVDLNEENALIEKPMTRTATVVIKSEKGYLYGDKIVQENGSIEVEHSLPINFRSMGSGARLQGMIMPKDYVKQPTEFKLKTKDFTITENGDLEIISLKKASIFKNNKKILKIPALKIYTNKNIDFAETNSFEIGSLRGLGLYAGPGFVFQIPGGSVLKAIPMLNYKHGIGVGGVARYSSASNWTQFAYGTAESKFLLRGKQKLDDNLYIQYAMNDYMREWFLGRRRPKYGASLVYHRGYGTKNFLVKDEQANFSHRIDLGYYQEGDEDSHMSSEGPGIGTTRARYMAEATQFLCTKQNLEKEASFRFLVRAQMAATLYGTGDSQVIGRVGPEAHMQYKRWKQEIGYFQSAYHDETPMPVFDAYRYGKSNVYLREYLRLNRYLTVSWFGSINLSGDAPNNRNFQENAFYITVGPDDVKFSLGYDIERERTMFLVEVMMDAKGATVEYDKMEIKQNKKAKKRETVKDETENDFKSPAKQPVLKHAVVEDVKVVEDVI